MSKRSSKKAQPAKRAASPRRAARPSALLDTRIIYCGDCLDQLGKLPDGCVDLIYIDPPFNSNRNYEVFWGETKEKRAFKDRHASTQAYIDCIRPPHVELSRVPKKTGSFYYHCDWHTAAAPTRQGRPRPESATRTGGKLQESGAGHPKDATNRLLRRWNGSWTGRFLKRFLVRT